MPYWVLECVGKVYTASVDEIKKPDSGECCSRIRLFVIKIGIVYQACKLCVSGFSLYDKSDAVSDRTGQTR